MFTAQEILVGNADYPTEKIGENSRKFRQLGLGYANLGALLMAQGLPYDSDGGRAWAAAITALMTGHAYATSARTAGRMGPFAGYAENADADAQRAAHAPGRGGRRSTRSSCRRSCSAPRSGRGTRRSSSARRYGVRNSQATVLAPTGTIGLMMDCDTTGIEPDLALTKAKKLVGGGTMFIVNQTIPRALRQLGYSDDAGRRDRRATSTSTRRSSARPGFNPEHLPVFACSMGDNTIHYMGHVKMMGAVQPFISRRDLQDREHARGGDGRGGRGAPHRGVAARPQGGRHLPRQLQGRRSRSPRRRRRRRAGAPRRTSSSRRRAQSSSASSSTSSCRSRSARSCRASRNSKTFSFRVADCHGYATVGEFEDGRPGELFLKVAKQGSTLAGIMDAFAISVSHGLQYGVPLEAFVEKFTNMRFEPAGMTDDPDIRIATSLVDYIFRRLAVEYLAVEERRDIGVLTVGERLQPTLPGVEEAATPSEPGLELLPPEDRAPSAAISAAPPAPPAPPAAAYRAQRDACSATSAATSCSAPAPATPARAAAPPAAARRQRFHRGWYLDGGGPAGPPRSHGGLLDGQSNADESSGNGRVGSCWHRRRDRRSRSAVLASPSFERPQLESVRPPIASAPAATTMPQDAAQDEDPGERHQLSPNTIRIGSIDGDQVTVPSLTTKAPTGRTLTPNPNPAPEPVPWASGVSPSPPPSPPPPRTAATGITVTPPSSYASPKTRLTVKTSFTASSFDSATDSGDSPSLFGELITTSSLSCTREHPRSGRAQQESKGLAPPSAPASPAAHVPETKARAAVMALHRGRGSRQGRTCMETDATPQRSCVRWPRRSSHVRRPTIVRTAATTEKKSNDSQTVTFMTKTVSRRRRPSGSYAAAC